MDSVYSVSELTAKIRASLANRFPFVWAKGEVSNFSRAASGHIYFSLKDERAQIDCVWFAARQAESGAGFDPLTGEIYETPPPDPREFLRDGVEILCAGAVTVYERRGRYQLQAELVQPTGVGKLAAEFEIRKAKLAGAGYFYSGRKRSLPASITRVALVASPNGAAVHDFLEIASSRGHGARIRLYPAPAQGEGAAAKIAAAIERANAEGWAQVLVVIRGGGSIEDLWAYNEEILAEAIFNSHMPVVAGIGHEVDFTLSDLTADVRAATPTHAAQLLWASRDELWQTVDGLTSAAERAFASALARFDGALEKNVLTLRALSPGRRLVKDEIALSRLDERRFRALASSLERKNAKYERLRERLLARYSGEDALISFNRKIDVLSGRILTLASRLPDRNAAIVAGLSRGGVVAFGNRVRDLAARAEILANAVRAANPYEPLRKGYAILFGRAGVIRSVKECRPGETAEIRLRDGALKVKIERVEKRVTMESNDD